MPTFADDEDKVNALISQSGDEDEDMEQLSNTPTIQTVQTVTPAVTTTTSQVSQSLEHTEKRIAKSDVSLFQSYTLRTHRMHNSMQKRAL